MQIAPLHYPHLSHSEIFESLETFYKRFYFRRKKIASLVGEMVSSPQMMTPPPARGCRILPVPAQPGDGELRRLIVCADDFGLDPAVNEAVEEAHRNGILSTASLMVGRRGRGRCGGARPPAARAARRPASGAGRRTSGAAARRSPWSRRRGGTSSIGTWCARVCGFSCCRGAAPARKGDPRAVRGFPRDRSARSTMSNAHKHMQLHPTVAALIIEIGRDYGLKAVRVPSEPVAALRRAFPGERWRSPPYRPWIARLAPAIATRRALRQRPRLRPRLERRHGRGAGPRAAPASAGRGQRNLFPPGGRAYRAACRGHARLSSSRRTRRAAEPPGQALHRRIRHPAQQLR